MIYMIKLTIVVERSAYEPYLPAHFAYLADLKARGALLLSGPFADRTGGLVLVQAASRAEAEAIAQADPLVANRVDSYELREWLITLRARYRAALPPIIITESGCSYASEPDADGVVDDQERIDYLDSHLRAIAVAIRAGVDVRGYYTWSLLDNFEWAEGFTQRFGLVYVDYETLARIPKRSFEWYAETIRAQPGDN